MKSYPKIQTLFKRDEKTHKLIVDEFSCPEFEYLRFNDWYFTEKVDGMNIRVVWESDELGHQSLRFEGRTDEAQMYPPLLTKLLEMFPHSLFPKFADIFAGRESACLYGEGYGPRIQKGGGNYRKDLGFVLFDVLVGNWWLQRADVERIGLELGIEVVPIVGTGDVYAGLELIQKGLFSRWGEFYAEGIVMRPMVDLKMRSGERVIAKLKRKDLV